METIVRNIGFVFENRDTWDVFDSFDIDDEGYLKRTVRLVGESEVADTEFRMTKTQLSEYIEMLNKIFQNM